MEHAYNKNDDGPVTEMSIVNTFTKLIFGDEITSARELLIMQAFRQVEANVLRDSPQEMGEYLRCLGVREMIQLVSRLRQHINNKVEAPADKEKQTVAAPNLAPQRPDRGSR